MKLNRGCFIGGILLLAGGCAGFTAEADLASLFTNLNGPRPPGKPRMPSILFIQCESLGYLDLGCNGQKQFATPNLDRLAASGMVFTNYDAGGDSGPETRAALLLGQAASPTPSALPIDEANLARILKAAGYFTGYFGQWDFGGQDSGSAPWQRGFDDFAGYFSPEEAGSYYTGAIWRCAPRSILNTTNHHWEAFIGQERLVNKGGDPRGSYIPDVYTRGVLGFLSQYHPDDANHHRPFFLWINYPATLPNPQTGELPVPTDAPYSEEAWPQAEKNKAAMIARLDGDIGKILDEVANEGLTNSVAVFFASATVPLKAGGLDPAFFPSVTSTNDARLPMIASWPGHIPAGRISGAHWSPANFLATAAEMAYTPYPTNSVGESILPALYGKPATNAPAKN